MAEMPFTAASFDQFVAQNKVMAVHCKKCGTLMVPPRGLCNKCGSFDLEWKQLSGKGKIVSFTVIGVGPTMMLNEGFDRDHPYCAGVVQLDEGPRMSAQILGVDVDKPENIKIGTTVVSDCRERGSFALAPEVAKVRKPYLVFKAG
jgi:uncharacterized OB-fold protein